ncbi:MAG: phosphoribosylglycinamide formyltransferase [Lachnospiraceae bacterium]|nr:phosphoribosylglycinamide formyltransferase [Lachnospiraceae bacterium]
MEKKVKIAVFVSGGGTNLQALIDAQQRGELHSGKIELVISNKEGAYALERAQKAGIETLTILKKKSSGCTEGTVKNGSADGKASTGNEEKTGNIGNAETTGAAGNVQNPPEISPQADFENLLVAALEEHGIELIILAGFMSILSADFTCRYPERIINVHPALIPSFCGKGFYGLKVHEAALEYGVKVTGATVHFVNEIPDGGRIIAQKAVYIEEGDTPEILQKRVMEQAEWILLPKAAEEVCAGILKS